MLGLAIENRNILGTPVADRFAARADDAKLAVVLKTINEKIPTHTVIFDVSTDRGIRSGNQMLTEIMYRLFLASLGYAEDLDLAELEIDLEQQGGLDEFKKVFESRTGSVGRRSKGMTIFALNEASAVLHKLNPTTFPMADSWAKGAAQDDISPGKLADRIVELMKRRKPGKSLMFVVDEVGQFVARDIQKMLDLQADRPAARREGPRQILDRRDVAGEAQRTGQRSRRPHDRACPLMDRFPLQVHLEPSDISEVTSRRVLAKKSAARDDPRQALRRQPGRLDLNSRITADIRSRLVTASASSTSTRCCPTRSN